MMLSGIDEAVVFVCPDGSLEHFPMKCIRFTVENAVQGKTRADSVQADAALATQGKVLGQKGMKRSSPAAPVAL
jgi:hypothetical protein